MTAPKLTNALTRRQTLTLSVRTRGRWRTIDADYYPPLVGDAATRAGELVVRGMEATLASGRRAPFHVAIGGSLACLYPAMAAPRTAATAEWVSNCVGESGGVFLTCCPGEDVDAMLAAFAALADDVRRLR